MQEQASEDNVKVFVGGRETYLSSQPLERGGCDKNPQQGGVLRHLAMQKSMQESRLLS